MHKNPFLRRFLHPWSCKDLQQFPQHSSPGDGHQPEALPQLPLLMWSWEHTAFDIFPPHFRIWAPKCEYKYLFLQVSCSFSNLKVWSAMFKKQVEALLCQIHVSDLGYSTLFFEGQVLTAGGSHNKVQQCFTG